MKTPLLFLTLLISIVSVAQNAADSLLPEQYCLVRIYEASLASGTVEVAVDYGQAKKRRVFGVEVMRDEKTGKKKIFRSEADALNYFGTEGWKLVTAYPVVENRSSYTHYLFKRTKGKDNSPAD